MDTSKVKWVEAADNPWGVRVLDVRQVTLGMLSSSRDPLCATNAVSYGQDDGTGFIGQTPPNQRTIDTNLRFRRDRLLADGALFIPNTMEHKWAIYFHQGRILFIRSWLRAVVAKATVDQSGDEVPSAFGFSGFHALQYTALSGSPRERSMRGAILAAGRLVNKPLGSSNESKLRSSGTSELNMAGKQPKRKDRQGVDKMGRSPLHYAAPEGDHYDVSQFFTDLPN